MTQQDKLPNRGEIWTSLLVGAGREQQGLRPVLIVSENRLNHSAFRLVIVVPLTTNTLVVRSRVIIEPPEGGLQKTSSAMCEQILRLDIEQRLLKRSGQVTPHTMNEVSWRLATLLGLS